MIARSMTGGFSAFLAALALLATLAVAGAATAAEPRAAARDLAAQVQTGEWSAAKKRRYVRRHARPAYAYRAPARIGGPDPSFDPHGRLYRRPSWGGSCVIDDGYGRFSACSNR